MASIVLTDEEWGLLEGQPHVLLKAYIAIRRHMDFGSCVAGVNRRLSEQWLREALYIEPRPGRRDSGSPTRKAVRHAVESLIGLGLLRARGDVGPFVFELPYAYAGTSAQNQWGHKGATMGPAMGPKGGQEKEKEYSHLAEVESGKGGNNFARPQSERGLPPNSELGTDTSNPNGLLVGSGADDEGGSGKGDLRNKTPDCPHQKIIDLYHQCLPANPRIRTWTAARSAHLRARWKEDPRRRDLDWWRKFFERINTACPFLTGRKTGSDGRPFTPGLDWIVKAENFTKILEGRYVEDAA